MSKQEVVLTTTDEAEFVTLLGSVYEHSPWVAEQLWRLKLRHPASSYDDILKVQQAMRDIVDASTEEEKLILLRAHPDLAGKAALSGELTDASKSEQAGAGLDQCSEDELAHFLQLNDEYHSKFGFPFIMAVKGATKAQILAGFIERNPNDWQTEFDRAMREVHKIAEFRLAEF
ncbi:2-oxo-4-hydroxy-4-carboxy-5-ureidoimidazoline decarboxylase [Marinomonas posidonica]|uniref:2-oxo-4-hydroxy-4-carboxy-5-ureidoimidazoline decarboxylase n=1 Tax=Marinomonas posidonica (strain CECT 7376 / NCIMB 14433 / IVIA-Po-181) TaxID=491952 RepID=F6CWR8_MARPP|nr:2-oxo-4-hydroxy-4-carboxy-5-ureidoimidazoline decarboxylase [Marinomonas posidonica]AEF54418.1 OHCU decarboxylase [Marinomonas posidonica IVIA-Po-181]